MPTTTITPSIKTYDYKEKIKIPFTVVDSNNRQVNNGKVQVYIDNKLLKTINYNKKLTIKKLNAGKHKLTLKYSSDTYWNSTKKASIKVNKIDSNLFANSMQATANNNIYIPINVTDQLNNTINEGKLLVYHNNKLQTTKKVQNTNKVKINKQKIGFYTVKIKYDSTNYKSKTQKIILTVNPKSSYTMRIIRSATFTTSIPSKIRAITRNGKNTLSTGFVQFYINNQYIGTNLTKNNLTTKPFKLPDKAGNYVFKAKYYDNNKNFKIADAIIMNVPEKEAQIPQNTFITIASDLINNSKVTTTKKDVYFAMDRTTGDTNYSPNDMKIMNNIANNLKTNGFNIKAIKSGPGETYEIARLMYNRNIHDSICFILCNGVDANVIREYLYGYDNLLSTVRRRGNDIVMGWFYGAGDIYNPDGEYYYYLPKAWDDNYSRWGGMANPRKTAENDGIKVIYERYDLKGNEVANSFIKLYGGKVTKTLNPGQTINIKTVLYKTDNTIITSGNIVYTLNGKVIKNMTINSNTVNFKYKMPTTKGTYNLKATYYLNNNKICNTHDRYIRIV